jgi:2'-5' RNA ligase
MPFAIQLFFDPASDTVVRSLWAELASKKVPFPLQDSGNRPHVSLAIYGELKTATCAGLLSSFAQTRSPLTLSIASLGIFPGEQAVVFLAPIISSSLLDLHRQVHQLLQNTGTLPSTYYLPGHWTPHCTLATRVPPQFLSQAIGVGLGMELTRKNGVSEVGD